MSSCKAPNCDLKNFDQCNSSLDFCSLQGISSGEGVAVRECNPKDTGIVNYLRTTEECNITSSIHGEFECKKKVGCEWGYPSMATDDLLEKKCIPNRKGVPNTNGAKTQAPYTCSEASGDTTLGSWNIGDDKETGRYSMQEQDTFGCPKDKCNYIPRKSERVDGNCSGAGGCESYIMKEQCLNVEDLGCIWNPNDSAYCGYNRSIKKTLGGGTNLNDFTLYDKNDVCRKVTNPSEEVCNHWGCIWDIKGKRNEKEEEEYVDYDITTSGICKYPNTEHCMDNYCSQNTRSSASGKRRGYHPDGRCKRGSSGGDNYNCESSKEMIISHKTPGLMKLPGHTSDENTEISNLQRVIDKKHRLHKEKTASNLNLNDTVVDGVEVLGERSKLKNEIKELYNKSCEKRGKYPGPADSHKVFVPNEYDVSLKECRNRSGGSDILDLCNSVKSNYESNEYKPYLEYQKSGKCLFTGYEGDEAVPANRSPAMKAATADAECDGCDSSEKIMKFGMSKCLKATGRNACINVDFGGECKDGDSIVADRKTKDECSHHKWTGNCTGTATLVAATCTGTARDGTTNCSINFAEQVGSTESDCNGGAGEGCEYAAENTPTCDRDAGTAECPAGCTEGTEVGEGSCSDDSNNKSKSECEETLTDYTWTGNEGYCQWHDPAERCRVKEESFNNIDCANEGSHPLCVQKERGSEDEVVDTANKTEAMKIRCDNDCSGFTPGAEAESSCITNEGETTGCVYTPALQKLVVGSIDIVADTVTLNPAEPSIAAGQLLRLTDADGGATCNAHPKDKDLIVASVNGGGEVITFEEGSIIWGNPDTDTNCVIERVETCLPDADTCTNTYENKGMCLNRDGEEVTCQIGSEPAIYVANDGDCTSATGTGTWIDNATDCTSQPGYHWYLPPVSDGCRDIPEGGATTDTCSSKWISDDGPLKQHLKCRKNYYKIHSYFKAEIKTRLDRGDKKDLLYNFLIGRNPGDTPDPTAYWELQEQYRSERHVGVGCVGEATIIPASCTGTAADSPSTCALDASPDGSAACPTGCTETDELTPTCDLDASTDDMGACPEGCIHIHGNSACDDRCENIKHKIHQIIQGYNPAADDYTKDKITSNLAHYFITLIQIKDSFDIVSGAITGGIITLAEALPIISTGDTVQIVGDSCEIVSTDHTINSIDGNTLTISGITGVGGGDECKLKILPNCKYDVARNLYRVDSEESRKHSGLYQLSIEDYPIITPTQGPLSGGEVSDTWTWNDDNGGEITIGSEDYKNFLSDDPEVMEHRIEDIKYAPGKATVLLDVEMERGETTSEVIINTAFKEIQKLDKISFVLAPEKQPEIKLKVEAYPLTSVKRYFNGMIEIEIDGVDPGRIENGSVEYLRDIYSIPLDGFDYQVHVREIRFHDIQMDIYFESDINNLYKKNDIIEIEKLQDSLKSFKKNFNRGYRLNTTPSGPIYNKVTDVDFIKNKITVDHIKRDHSGKYFPGRYMTEPKQCIVETITKPSSDTIGNEFTFKDYVAPQLPHCDYKRDLWKTCLELEPASEETCYGTDEKCRDRQIEVQDIAIDTYCMKNGVPTVDCDAEDIAVVGTFDTMNCVLTPSTDFGVNIGGCASTDSSTATCNYVNGVYSDSGSGSLDTVDTPDSCSSILADGVDKLTALGWGANGVEWVSEITELINDLNNFHRAAGGTTDKITLYEHNTTWVERINEVIEKITNVTSAPTPFGDSDLLAATDADGVKLQLYSEVIKLATDILNDIKYLAKESVDGAPGWEAAANTEFINLSERLKTLEGKLDLNNKHISHYMNIDGAGKTNMIKVDSDYATQVQELLKPREDGTRPTIKLMGPTPAQTSCTNAEGNTFLSGEEAKVLDIKTVVDDHAGTYIIIDQFIDIDPSEQTCKLEIEPAENFSGFKCIPNDVRFNGKIEDSKDGAPVPLADKWSCNEIQHKYDLPNRLERKMCEIKGSNNQIMYDSMFDADRFSKEANGGTNSEDGMNLYGAPHSIFAVDGQADSTTFKNGDLDGWVIEYITEPGGTLGDKKTGLIRSFTSNKGEGKYVFEIQHENRPETSENIIPLSIYEKVNGFEKDEEADKKLFTIKNYIRKDVNELPMMDVDPQGYGAERLKYFPGINTRSTCEYNNGIWEDLECKSHDVSSSVRNIDLCENTGYNWKEKMNVCMLDGEYDETQDYCGNKVTHDNGETPPTNPCPTCKYNDDTKICEMQEEKVCMEYNSKELCAEDKTCEYYIDRMEKPGPDLKPQAFFNCEEKPGSAGDTSVCIIKTNRPDCEEANCEWQCPFTPDSRNQQGYVVKTSIDGVSSPNVTLNNQTDNYYAPSDLTVTCDPTWEQSESGVIPSITCIENADPDPRVDEHTHRMASIGCRPKINCGGNEINNGPLTGEVLRSLDLNQVPNVFKTGTGGNEAIDPTKFPNSEGSFNCPSPQTLRDNASGIAFWNKEQCCYSTGLCKDNTEPSEDVVCPTGKIHKKAYYGESTEYLPAKGTTEEVCCIVPEVPTITVPLDADYNELAGSAGTVLRDTFEQNFCTDIVTILNASEHIEVPVTSSMCEILDINDGSVVVTFRINKDTDGNVVLTDQLSKAISSGTTFPTVGAVSNAEPHYKPFDPKAKYLFWSDTLKKGITLEQLIITIFMFLCIISSGLAVMGIILK